MSKLQLEALQERLLRAGVAPRHVRRYLTELRQHFDDLLRTETGNGLVGEAAAQAARARLGTDDGLAKAMLVRPELRSLAIRAPWLVFGMTPIFLTFGTFALAVSLALLTGWLGGLVHHMDIEVAPMWFRLLCHAAAFTATFIEPVLAASVLVMLAARQRMPLRWPLIGIAVIAVFGMHVDASFPAPGTPGGSIGLSFPIMPVVDMLQGHSFSVQWPFFIGQLGLSLLPALWLIVGRPRSGPSLYP